MSNEVEIRVTGKNASQPAVAAARKDVKGLTQDVVASGQAYDSAGKKAKEYGRTAKDAATIAAGILSADAIKSGARIVVDQIRSTISAASNLGESTNAVSKIFKQNSAEVQQWGQQNAASYGLSKRAFNEYATPLGAALKNAGLDMRQTTDYTIKLTKRAADMASVFNVDVGDALGAIQAGLRGEADPLERFGVSLSAARVQARALADSGKASASSLTSQELVLARLNILFDQTKDTEGDFIGTQDGLANASRKANAEIENAKANIGAGFLPVIAAGAKATGVLASALSAVPGPALITVAAIAALGAAFVIAGPKIKAARDTLDDMRTSTSRTTRGLGRLISFAGKAAGVITLVEIAGAGLSRAFESNLNPQLEAATAGLDEFARGGKVSGESARIFGSNLGEVSEALRRAGNETGFNQFMNGLGKALGGTEVSFKDGTERVKTFDAALSELVRNNRADEAIVLINEAARQSGQSFDEVKKQLPQYAAALDVAARAERGVGSAADKARADVDELYGSFKKTTDAAFAQGSAADAVQQDLADLAEQIKKNSDAHEKGAKSLEGNTQAARDNREKVRGLTEDTAKLAVENQKAGLPVDGLKKDLENQLAQMGLSRKEIDKYTQALDELIIKLGNIPPIVSTTYVIRNAGTRTDKELALRGMASGGISGYDGGAAATGGARGGYVTMNEYGPERIRLPFGSTVYSNSQSRSMDERGDMLDGRGPAALRGPQELILRGDGSQLAELLIRILQVTISAKGGRPDILGLKIQNA